MTARSKRFSAMTRCLVVPVATAVLGVTWGCGGGIPSQATLDDAAKARVQEAQDSEKRLLEKRAAKATKTTRGGSKKSGRLSQGDLENR
jgi:hypothetical protein